MRTENILLILGLIFSIILITFRIDNGIEFLNSKFEVSIINIAFNKSNQTYLTSAILGYFVYLIFSLVMMKKTKGKRRLLVLIFSVLTLIGIFFELKVFFESLNGIYNGTHFRIGILLGLIGFLIANRINKTELNK